MKVLVSHVIVKIEPIVVDCCRGEAVVVVVEAVEAVVDIVGKSVLVLLQAIVDIVVEAVLVFHCIAVAVVVETVLDVETDFVEKSSEEKLGKKKDLMKPG